MAGHLSENGVKLKDAKYVDSPFIRKKGGVVSKPILKGFKT